MNGNRQQTAEIIWLHYFNDVLYRRGLITEHERNRMALKINNRKPPCINKRNGRLQTG